MEFAEPSSIKNILKDSSRVPSPTSLNAQLSEHLALQEMEEAKLSLLLLQRYLKSLELNLKCLESNGRYSRVSGTAPITYRKKNELEQLKTMLAMAMESGDVNALYALGTLLNEAALPLSDTTAPVVNDKEPKENPLQMEEMMTLLQAAVPIQKKDETLTRMKEKQRVKEQELADRLAQQSDMMSSAQSQYEDLVAKRAELNSLQAKFSMLSKEQESKGMVNHRVPEELDDETTDATMKPAPTETFTRLNPSRGSSQITLMPPEEADADTDMDDLEENYNRLQEQEEEMSYLRQQLLVLQSVKNQLETQKKSMLEHVMAQEESDVVSNNLEIETVRLREITTDTEEEAEEFEDELQVQDVSDLPMEQLMESDKLRGIIPEELTLENLLDRLLAVSVHDKVDSSVEGNAESTEEQDALVWKSGAPFQSAEAAPLVEEITIEQDMQPMETTDRVRSSILQAQEHIADLKEAMDASQDPNEREVYSGLHEQLLEQLKELSDVETKLNLYKSLADMDTKDVSDEQTQTPATMREIPKADATEASKQPLLTRSVSVTLPRPVPVSRGMTEQKRPASATFSRAPLSRARPSLPSSAKVAGAAKTRKLFESRKDEIYKSAASLISSLESEPYFLMSLFKKVSKMNNLYLRQKLLLVLDELVEEQEEEQQVDEVADEERNFEKLIEREAQEEEDSFMTRLEMEEMIKDRIADYLVYMDKDGQDVELTSAVLSEINVFVVNIIFSTLFAMTKSNDEKSDEVRLTMLMEAVRQNLTETLLLFEGYTMSLKQAPLLNALLDLVGDTLMTWDRTQK